MAVMPKWWHDVLEYIRVAPGRIYPEQALQRLAYFYQCDQGSKSQLPKAAFDDVVSFLNTYDPERSAPGSNRHILKSDVLTGGIYTVPSQRAVLDELLHRNNPKYSYNKYLYMDTLEPGLPHGMDMAALLLAPEDYPGVFAYEPETGELSVDLTALGKPGEEVVIHGFHLGKLVNELSRRWRIHCIGVFNAAGVRFTGDTEFALDDYKTNAVCARGACFNGATFCGRFEMRGITFTFDAGMDQIRDGYEENKVDFRNARFFGAAAFKDVRFLGDMLDMEVSLEDARIQEKIEFFNVDFGHASLNCFQMVVGGFVDRVTTDGFFNSAPQEKRRAIRLSNVTAEEDVTFDFSDVEMDQGEVVFSGIPMLPLTKLCLSPIRHRDPADGSQKIRCPENYLLLWNCEIHKTLYVGNFSEFSLRGTHNYGRIVGSDNWGKVHRNKGEYRTRSRGMVGTAIDNDLLLALYNDRQTGRYTGSGKDPEKTCRNQLALSKAQGFTILKENFQAMGMYDEEDVAVILYMEFKPYVDSIQRSYLKRNRQAPTRALLTDLLYRILYETGQYGISPLRAVVATMVLLGVCAVLYFMAAITQGTDAFTLGSAMSGFWREGYTNPTVLDAFLASCMFSLECVVPFVSQYEPISMFVCVVTAIENAIGSFLVGYFSVAIVRKTLRS